MGFGARERFVTAAAMTLAASFVIRRPLAFSIAAALGMVISDPEAMKRAAAEWKTKNAGGSTAELGEIRDSVKSLLERLQTDAKWEAGTREIVDSTLKSFISETENCEKQRDGVGDALDSCGNLYETLSWVAMGIATAMTVWAGVLLASKATPVTALAAEAGSNAVVSGLWATIRPTMMKLMTFLVALGLLYSGVTALTAEQSAKFMGMEVQANFSGTGLGNDQATGRLTPQLLQDPKLAQQLPATGGGGMPSLPV
ncbi:hypothetical protein [Nonomuraea typhae]|uniref:hypothetical protein n=1 Tax=Nonomuraea typhae TaxID=2603600 RepID=UPI0012F70B68|nr:hypothetical protein [Nonomuraea typhae]